jgi:uncharacterized phage-associated protein
MATQFDRDKYREAILYICSKCDPDRLGAVKLNKVLYFSDMVFYAIHRRPITGETYRKQQFGPVAQHLRSTLSQLQAERLLIINEADYHGYRKRQFAATRAANMARFHDDERAFIDDAIRFVCHQNTAKTISEVTHNQVWEAAAMGEELPYFTAFGMFPVEITEEDVQWGAGEAQRIAAEELRPS